MVRIRLRRVGRKNSPIYRIVVADSQSPRDGRFIEVIGQYSPREVPADGAKTGRLSIETERAHYWLDVGAQPSDTVRSLLRRAGVLKVRHEARVATKRQAGAVAIKDDAERGAASGD
jgi:small subunit ribosomal protein S16